MVLDEILLGSKCDKPFSRNDNRFLPLNPRTECTTPKDSSEVGRKSSLNHPSQLKRPSGLAMTNEFKQKKPSLALPERNSLL
jgi:hypothetical protein